MELRMKQRVIGGVVVVSVLAIFLPVLLHKPAPLAPQKVTMNIPQPDQLSFNVDGATQDTQAQQATSVQQVAQSQPLTDAAQPVSAPEAVQPQPSLQTAEQSVPEPAAQVAQQAVPPVIQQQSVEPPVLAQAEPVKSLPTVKHHHTRVSHHHRAAPGMLVQVASFGDSQNASHLVKKLRAKGFDAHTQVASVSGEKITRVVIGPIAEEKTNTVEKKLQHDFHLHGIVRKSQA